MAILSVKIGKLKLKNPVLVASGTFGYGEEFKDLVNLNKLGAIVTKTVTLTPRQGNSMPRTIETPCGLLNSIGLQNPGSAIFILKIAIVTIRMKSFTAIRGKDWEISEILSLISLRPDIAAISRWSLTWRSRSI